MNKIKIKEDNLGTVQIGNLIYEDYVKEKLEKIVPEIKKIIFNEKDSFITIYHNQNPDNKIWELEDKITQLQQELDKYKDLEFACKHCGVIQKPKMAIERITNIEKINQNIREICKE